MSDNIEVVFEKKPPEGAVRAVLGSAEAVAAIASTSRAVTPKEWATVAGHLKSCIYLFNEEASSPLSSAVVALCARMIESGNKQAIDRAIQLLWVSLPPTAGGAAVLASLLRRDPDWRLLRDIHRGFVRHPDAADHLDALREQAQGPNWHAAVAARHSLEQLSQPVAPYRYQGFIRPGASPIDAGWPWIDTVHERSIHELARLGGSVEVAPPASGHPAYYSSERKQSWSGEDPLGQFAPPTGVIWNVYGGLRFEASVFTHARPGLDKRQLSFMTASENFDKEVDGRRRLLAPIAYAESLQYYYCVDLSEAQPTTTDPAISIWSIDHDGTGAGRLGSLYDFLKQLRPAKRG